MQNKKPQIILGIDPGYARAGWGVIEKQGQKLRLIEYGCYETPKEMPHAERLSGLHFEIKRIIAKHKPEIMAVEDLFFLKT
jgi:crossover junction endodeoxyribonuclease RuvC